MPAQTHARELRARGRRSQQGEEPARWQRDVPTSTAREPMPNSDTQCSQNKINVLKKRERNGEEICKRGKQRDKIIKTIPRHRWLREPE